jgi:hypothetical protein
MNKNLKTKKLSIKKLVKENIVISIILIFLINLGVVLVDNFNTKSISDLILQYITQIIFFITFFCIISSFEKNKLLFVKNFLNFLLIIPFFQIFSNFFILFLDPSNLLTLLLYIILGYSYGYYFLIFKKLNNSNPYRIGVSFFLTIQFYMTLIIGYLLFEIFMKLQN